jgi:hypothetical protein
MIAGKTVRQSWFACGGWRMADRTSMVRHPQHAITDPHLDIFIEHLLGDV